MMSLLGIAYVNACIEESKEEKRQKKEEKIRRLKERIFYYAVKHQMLYDEVVQKIQNKELSIEDIENES